MKLTVIIFGIIIVALLGILIFVPAAKSPTVPATTEPSVAVSPDGNVRVVSPTTNAVIASPAVMLGTVTGGGWFFEASFPVKVLDGDGSVLGQGPAQAQGDWMSTGTVPFGASIPFAQPRYPTGTIVFSKDNPSGLAQNAESFSLPVVFGQSGPWSGGVPGAITDGIVRGSVVLSPTCPVLHIPPDPQCAPKPYQTSITISKNIETPEAFKTIQNNASGTFSVSLPAGEYVFHPQGGSAYPRCEEKLVKVVVNQTNEIVINCDTGIR